MKAITNSFGIMEYRCRFNWERSPLSTQGPGWLGPLNFILLYLMNCQEPKISKMIIVYILYHIMWPPRFNGFNDPTDYVDAEFSIPHISDVSHVYPDIYTHISAIPHISGIEWLTILFRKYAYSPWGIEWFMLVRHDDCRCGRVCFSDKPKIIP